jgi:hypothetical protein
MSEEEDELDIYNVENYTERELFEILDINNPTDRELEISIHKNIEKHKIGTVLHNFFKDMYDRFFDDDDDNDNEVEGFADVTTSLRNRVGDIPTTTTNPVFNSYDATISRKDANDRLNPGISASITNPATGTNVTSGFKVFSKDDQALATTTTHNMDYVKDKLNPIKRETMFKMISIDSQFREDPRTTSATNFTMNLSSTIENVIAIKLYSVQIPYTWYMVNENSGSNYFYIKGNSPGINNGLNDIKVDIGSGNYSPADLITTINTRFDQLSKETDYIDVSFGKTKIVYDSTSAKVRFEIDVKKIFTDADYQLYFPNWSSPTIINNQNPSIASFLGFNFQSYKPLTVYGNRTAFNINAFTSNLNENFNLTNDNNFFTVIQYIGPNQYVQGVSTVLKSIVLKSNLIINTVTHNRQSIYNNIKLLIESNQTLFLTSDGGLQNDIFDLDYTSFNLVSVTNSSFEWSEHNHYELSVKLNRKTTINDSNTKIIVIFPYDPLWTNDKQIWVGQNSCFRFDNSHNEISEIVSETAALVTNYVIGSGKDTIVLTCTRPSYNVSENTFVATIPDSSAQGYLLNEYTDAINSALATMNLSTISQVSPNGFFNINGQLKSTNFKISLAKANFQFDITRNFDQSTYIIDLSNCFLSKSPFNFGNGNGLVNFQTADEFVLSKRVPLTSGTILNTEYITITPKKTSINGVQYGNQNEDAQKFYLTTGKSIYDINSNNFSYNSFEGLTDFLNTFFANATDIYNQNILSESKFEATFRTFNNINAYDVSLSLIIKNVISENEYKVEFINTGENTWSNYLGLDSSYNLANYLIAPHSEIIGNKIIYDNTIQITTNNNILKFVPYYNGVYDSKGENDITITIPSGSNYTRDSLITVINNQLTTSDLTNGSLMSIIKNENYELAKIRMCINKIFTTIDYKLVFYDSISFSYCSNVGTTGGKSVKTGTWDSTLGWLMGFHSFPEYILNDFTLITNANVIDSNYYYNYYTNLTDGWNYSVGGKYSPVGTDNTGKIAVKGDSVLNTNLYNYFLIVLDDYIQNHVNDGLITITSVENDIALPTYANRVSYQCDPVTGKKVAISATNNLNTNLTTKQLYAMNQIIETRRNREKSYSSGPVLKDVFALVPLKLAGLSFGNTYMEFGGTLQNQDRKYFGPVRIQKFTVKLMNDKGEVVNLNGTNWSFTIICEIMATTAK